MPSEGAQPNIQFRVQNVPSLPTPAPAFNSGAARSAQGGRDSEPAGRWVIGVLTALWGVSQPVAALWDAQEPNRPPAGVRRWSHLTYRGFETRREDHGQSSDACNFAQRLQVQVVRCKASLLTMLRANQVQEALFTDPFGNRQCERLVNFIAEIRRR